MAPTDPSAGVRLDLRVVQSWLRRTAREVSPETGIWLHREVARRLGERLEVIRLRPGRWLDAGGSPGSSVGVLRKAYPDAQGVVVEPDAAWAARTRAASRRPWWSRPFAPRAPLTLGPGDAWPADPVELIWSNLALHHDPDPPQTFARWQGALAPGGFVMFSCLGPDSFKELRALYRDEGFGPCGHDFVDMHDLGDMLVHAGFADPVMDQERLTLTWSDAGRLLADLRLIGGNAAPARFAGLRTPRWRGRLLRRLESMRDPAGRIAMTAEVAYGHAFKVERAPRAAAPTTISVEALRATARTRAPRAVGGGE